MSAVGIIDIGTNTILCLKANLHNGTIDIISDTRFHYRAGSRLDLMGNISDEYKTGMRSALNMALRDLTDCDRVKIVATEVLRKPKDGRTFAKILGDEISREIEVIEPQREAELSFAGVVQGISRNSHITGMIDIGGGSSELAIGTGNRLEHWSSLPIGAVSLSEAVGYEKPLALYLAYTENLFGKSDFQSLLDPSPSPMIIVGGSAVALAAIIDDQVVFNSDRLADYVIHKVILSDLLNDLAVLDLNRRRQILEFDKPRADIIVPGGAIILAFMNKFRFNEVKISTRGLRHGILQEMCG